MVELPQKPRKSEDTCEKCIAAVKRAESRGATYLRHFKKLWHPLHPDEEFLVQIQCFLALFLVHFKILFWKWRHKQTMIDNTVQKLNFTGNKKLRLCYTWQRLTSRPPPKTSTGSEDLHRQQNVSYFNINNEQRITYPIVFITQENRTLNIIINQFCTQ